MRYAYSCSCLGSLCVVFALSSMTQHIAIVTAPAQWPATSTVRARLGLLGGQDVPVSQRWMAVAGIAGLHLAVAAWLWWAPHTVAVPASRDTVLQVDWIAEAAPAAAPAPQPTVVQAPPPVPVRAVRQPAGGPASLLSVADTAQATVRTAPTEAADKPLSDTTPTPAAEPAAPAAPATLVAVASTPAMPPAAAAPPKNLPPESVQYLVPPAPVYPRLSRRQGESGRVLVRVYIDEAGLPRTVQVQASSGHARLDDAALQAVLQARFKPYAENGRPMGGWALIPLTFDLEK